MASARGPRARARTWPLGPAATFLLVLASAATGATGALALHRAGVPHPHAVTTPIASHAPPAGALRGDATWAPGRRLAPAFALRDQAGRQISLRAQRGHPVLLAFMDSHCRFICTLEGPTISDALRRVGAGRRVTLLVVSVNPWQDTAASSRAAAARYGLTGDWHWLRGSPAELRAVWRGYGIEVARTAGDVSHSTAIYLIDRRGYERVGFDSPSAPDQLARDLRRLARPRAS
jgi:protein SCO1/2